MKEIIIKIKIPTTDDYQLWFVKIIASLYDLADLLWQRVRSDVRTKYYLPMIIVTVGLVWWQFGFFAAGLWIIFIFFLSYQFDSRFLAVVALILLSCVPILAIFKQEAASESLALYSFLLLIMTVLLQIGELFVKKEVRKDKSLPCMETVDIVTDLIAPEEILEIRNLPVIEQGDSLGVHETQDIEERIGEAKDIVAEVIDEINLLKTKSADIFNFKGLLRKFTSRVNSIYLHNKRQPLSWVVILLVVLYATLFGLGDFSSQLKKVFTVNDYSKTIKVPLDSDMDGLLDEEEIRFGSDILAVDTDKDGLTDFDEVKTYHTNPVKIDTDGDGYGDGAEIKNGYNPNGDGKLLQTHDKANGKTE